MARYRIAAGLLCFSLSAAGAAWPTYHGGPDLLGTGEVDLKEPLELVWRYNTNGRVDETPVSDGTRIYISAGKGRIIALNPEGAELWSRSFSRTNAAGAEMPVRFDAPLACHSNQLLAGSSRGILYALDAETGVERWRYDTGGILLGSPSFSDGSTVVVLDQGTGMLHALDLQNGRLKWETDGVERCDGSPGSADGRILFGSCLAALHVYDAQDGRHLRDIPLGDDGQVAGGVAVTGNIAFFGARDGRLICANVESGQLIWSSIESKDETFQTPAVSTGLVVYASDNGMVYGLDRKTGNTNWTYDTEGIPSSPVITGQRVVVSADGRLILLKSGNGEQVWIRDVSDEITSPAVIKDMIVVGADDGTVTAWRAAGLSTDRSSNADESSR